MRDQHSEFARLGSRKYPPLTPILDDFHIRDRNLIITQHLGLFFGDNPFFRHAVPVDCRLQQGDLGIEHSAH